MSGGNKGLERIGTGTNCLVEALCGIAEVVVGLAERALRGSTIQAIRKVVLAFQAHCLIETREVSGGTCVITLVV